MSKKSKFIIVIIILAVIGWYKFGHKHESQAPNKKLASLVRVADVVRKDMPIEFETIGTVVPTESVVVRSRLDSQITQVNFHDGDFVKKGQLLFVLDNRALNAQLKGQEANLLSNKAQLENLEQQYKRDQELISKDFVSPAELDQSKAAYEAQKAMVKATEAAVQNLKVQLEYTKITAPISGRTGTINVTLGNNVKANDTVALVTINKVQPIRVQFSLPQTYLASVRQALNTAGIDIYIKQDGGKDPLHGKLEYIDNNIDQQTNTFVAKALFDNDEEILWPGMFVNITVRLGTEKQVLTIPEVAIQHGQEENFVFTINNNIAKNITVKSERVQNGTAIIQSGLKEGDKVAVDGIMGLSDGATVKIYDPQDNAQQKNVNEQNSDKAP
jgi:multidrug efflux system membrane fusion protein